tara:strand:- start:88 stop:588 length:501 start_codon:yes stop_codon:yes gene_type:complete
MDINLALKKLERDDNNYRLSTNADDSSATIVFWDSNNSDPQPSVGDLQQAWTDYQNDIEPNYNTDKSNPRHVVLTETTYECTGTVLDPANGTVQYKTLSGNVTFTEVLEDGEFMYIQISAGSYTVTFPTITWIGGSAPTLSTSKPTAIELWKIGTTLYGANVGDIG